MLLAATLCFPLAASAEQRHPSDEERMIPSPVDDLSRHALAEWHLRSDTFPASCDVLSRLIADLPAAIRLARAVTGQDYTITAADTSGYRLATPRGIIALIDPVRRTSHAGGGIFEAVGTGEIHRAGGVFRGRYAMRMKYECTPTKGAACRESRGSIDVYIDIDNRFLRLFALLARGIINSRLAEETERMLLDAKNVMTAAEDRTRRSIGF